MPGSDSNLLNQMMSDTRQALAVGFLPAQYAGRVLQAPVVDAKEYNEQYVSDRRITGEYIGVEAFADMRKTIRGVLKRADNEKSETYGDLVILYLLAVSNEEIEQAQQFIQQTPPENPRIVFALHRHGSLLSENLLSHHAADHLLNETSDPEIKSECSQLLPEIHEAIEGLIGCENWFYFHEGELVEKSPDLPDTRFASDLMEKLYPHSFNPHHRALGLHHKLDPQYRMMVKGVLKQLFDFSKPILLKSKDLDRTGEIFSALAKLGLMAPIDEEPKPGTDQEWEVESDIDEENPIHPLWSFLLYKVLGVTHKDGEVKFSQIYNILSNPPLGLNENLIRLLFGVFWRCYHDYMDLYDSRTYDQEIVENINPQLMDEIIKGPENWKLVKANAQPSEKEVPILDLLSREETYMRIITRLFESDSFDEERYDYTWDEARDLAVEWVNRYVKLTSAPGAVSTEVYSFVKILEGCHDIDSRELFLAIVPNVFGFEPETTKLIHEPKSLERSIRRAVEDVEDLAKDLSVKSHKIYKRKSKVAWEALSDELSLTGGAGDLFGTQTAPAASTLPPLSATTPSPAAPVQRTIQPAPHPAVSIAQESESNYDEPSGESWDEQQFMEDHSQFVEDQFDENLELGELEPDGIELGQEMELVEEEIPEPIEFPQEEFAEEYPEESMPIEEKTSELTESTEQEHPQQEEHHEEQPQQEEQEEMMAIEEEAPEEIPASEEQEEVMAIEEEEPEEIPASEEQEEVMAIEEEAPEEIPASEEQEEVMAIEEEEPEEIPASEEQEEVMAIEEEAPEEIPASEEQEEVMAIEEEAPEEIPASEEQEEVMAIEEEEPEEIPASEEQEEVMAIEEEAPEEIPASEEQEEVMAIEEEEPEEIPASEEQEEVMAIEEETSEPTESTEQEPPQQEEHHEEQPQQDQDEIPLLAVEDEETRQSADMNEANIPILSEEEETETETSEATRDEEIPILETIEEEKVSAEVSPAREETVPAEVSPVGESPEPEEKLSIDEETVEADSDKFHEKAEKKKTSRKERFKLARPNFSGGSIKTKKKSQSPPLKKVVTKTKPADPVEDIWVSLSGIFNLPMDGTGEQLEKSIQGWLEEVKSDKYSRAYRGDSKILYEILKSGGQVREKLMEQLPQKLGMGQIKSWKYDRSRELSARIDKARYQMSVMKYLEMKALPRTEKGKNFLIKWLIKVLKALKMSPQESKAFVESYIQEIKQA